VGFYILTSTSYPLPNLFLISYVVPIHYNDPSTYIAILVERASASSMECVVRITDDDLLTVEILEITSHMNLLASGSIPVEGSSKNAIEGYPSIAIATLSFLLLPPENYPARTPSNFFKSISTSFFSTSLSRK
jgi:hypothetical protein